MMRIQSEQSSQCHRVAADTTYGKLETCRDGSSTWGIPDMRCWLVRKGEDIETGSVGYSDTRNPHHLHWKNVCWKTCAMLSGGKQIAVLSGCILGYLLLWQATSVRRSLANRHCDCKKRLWNEKVSCILRPFGICVPLIDDNCCPCEDEDSKKFGNCGCRCNECLRTDIFSFGFLGCKFSLTDVIESWDDPCDWSNWCKKTGVTFPGYQFLEWKQTRCCKTCKWCKPGCTDKQGCTDSLKKWNLVQIGLCGYGFTCNPFLWFFDVWKDIKGCCCCCCPACDEKFNLCMGYDMNCYCDEINKKAPKIKQFQEKEELVKEEPLELSSKPSLRVGGKDRILLCQLKQNLIQFAIHSGLDAQNDMSRENMVGTFMVKLEGWKGHLIKIPEKTDISHLIYKAMVIHWGNWGAMTDEDFQSIFTADFAAVLAKLKP